MPVQKHQCSWPTCLAESPVLPMIGLDGDIHIACPFHHQWILREMEDRSGAALPISERKNPSNMKDIRENPYLVWCDADPKCLFRVSAKTEENGKMVLANHTCPHVGGPSRIGVIVSKTKLVEAWTQLDSAVVELLEGVYPPEEITRLKGVCRGMAEMLALFMEPHFKTADEISGEARRRYKAKKAGEEYTTPGLEPHKFATPRSHEYKAAANKAGAVSPKPVAAKGHKLSEKETSAIKFAMESGMFKPIDLAKTYGVSEQIIKEICGA